MYSESKTTVSKEIGKYEALVMNPCKPKVDLGNVIRSRVDMESVLGFVENESKSNY